MKILVTAARAPSGASIRHLLAGHQLAGHPAVETVGVDARDGFPWGADPSWPSALAEAAADCDYILLASDPELAAMDSLEAAVQAKVVTCGRAVRGLGMDKAALYDWAAHHQLPAPRYITGGLVKDRFADAARQAVIMRVPNSEVVCEYLPGREFSCDLAFFHGVEIGRVVRQRLGVDGGTCVRGRVLPSNCLPELNAVLRALATTGELHGGLSIQFIGDSQDRACLTDLNVRFGGGITIAAAAGVNLPKMLVNCLLCPDRICYAPAACPGNYDAVRVWA